MKAKSAQKFIIMLASLLVGVCFYFGAHAYFARDLTEWQKSRPVDLKQQTGTSKLKAHVDAASVGAAAFGVSLLLLFIKLKRAQKARKDDAN